MGAAVQRHALFGLENTLINLDEAFQIWAGKFAEEHDSDREAVDWLIALERAGYPHRAVFFTKVRDRLTLPEPVDELSSHLTLIDVRARRVRTTSSTDRFTLDRAAPRLSDSEIRPRLLHDRTRPASIVRGVEA
ncbi:hypothetical protein ACLQ2R_01330 [Streptosporangium sp. DT93]|uniref:hypothetical protein n=1 Tax=Streptosporangium sp. DT93 TaxID=3393428 RepID=UPI003CEFE5EF